MNDIATATKPAGAIDLRDIEQLAVELADIAGNEIKAALGGLLAVRYKTAATDDTLWRDPVSEVDRRVETMIRKRLADEFPDHDIIGEEYDERRHGRDFIWVVDPIDGTTNFVNGLPLFAASIGVLHKGRPVVGALWCSVSHALRAGVYHAAAGNKLRFDGADVTPKINPDVRRKLAGVPELTSQDASWDTRKTGSAALECAMVAAGLLQAARFASPNIWDVGGGIALVQAAGGVVRQSQGDGWKPMYRFEPGAGPDGAVDLRYWRRAIVVGRPDAVETMCAPTSDPAI